MKVQYCCDTPRHNVFSREPILSEELSVWYYGSFEFNLKGEFVEKVPEGWTTVWDPANQRWLHLCPSCSFRRKAGI